MPTRYSKLSDVGEYQPLHITTLNATPAPVGAGITTTTTTSIAPGIVVVTPASMHNIAVGTRLKLVNGSTWEDTTVTATTSTTFTAPFANAYSGTTNIYSTTATSLGKLVVGQAGTSVSITLYNGLPGMLPVAGAAFAVISPAPPGYDFQCTCDLGLFYTVTGATAGDYTLMWLDQSE